MICIFYTFLNAVFVANGKYKEVDFLKSSPSREGYGHVFDHKSSRLAVRFCRSFLKKEGESPVIFLNWLDK
ncbi:hypothetical protein SAMN04488109_5972 [Chryseolinea serpens]|uniref:Uncharacterized protein n=1 Tax=Chryseolinea serpens TaxID=947013 RepID=A0A1M5WSV1_9BACT|nr:hypothetical protein SAMN04488109_5972 [Chryseolinea serpens]